MLSNYIRIAFRNLFRNKSYAAINISGIAVGITAFSLFALYIFDDLSFDRFHTNSDRIVRVVHHAVWDGGEAHHAVTSAPFAPALKDEFPEVEKAVRISAEGGGVITFGDKVVKANNIYYADNGFFDVFTFPFLYGNPATALQQPEAIVLTESLATTLFQKPADALNQTIYFENNYPVKVTGVVKDVPQNSHLQFQAIRSLRGDYMTSWMQSELYTYLLLAPSTNYKDLEAKLPGFAKKTILKEGDLGVYNIELQPLTSIHLHSDLQFEISANSNMGRIYLFVVLAVLILSIAIINYMNLSTARAFLRIKEVGVRKVIGSRRSDLVAMFIIDALLISIVAALVAFVLLTLLLPAFNVLAGKNLTLWSFGAYQPLLIITAFAILIGIISGSYPAWFLSRFKTTAALKGLLGDLSNSVFFRKSLVVFQFTVTIIMIAGSIVILQQMQFISKKDLGFNKEQVITFHIDQTEVRKRIQPLKDQLLQNSAIAGVATAGNPIGNNDLGTKTYYLETSDGSLSESATSVQELVVDPDYITTMGIQIIQGRNFNSDRTTDQKESVIINETLANDMGWDKPIGKRVQIVFGEVKVDKKVVGVIKDFHTYSLQHKVQPMILALPVDPNQEDNLYVRINGNDTKAALAHIEQVYRQFDKTSPMDFSFLDQNFERQYSMEQKQEQLSLMFTGLAVFIACMGLFGLAAFTAQQRVKEIGIRKVLGATVPNIVMLLSTEFIKLVIISSVIAVPAASWAMDKWLQEFAYRIDVQWIVYLLAAAAALLIALGTVSVQAFKAAVTNPVDSLRSE
jgi:putative ABC transport system permease protein